MMKFTLPILALLFFSLPFYSQVGIGTTNPDPSSALEVQSTDSGILIPRVALTNTTVAAPIASPAVSLLVYNTNTAGDVVPGFYYWTGTAWKALVPSGGGGSGGWGLTGNSVVGTDFLGTTNYQPIRFTVNNSSYGQMHPGGGVAFGNGAAANNNNSIALGTSAASTVSGEAVAIGPSANASGYRSQAMGYTAAASTSSALALGNNTTASGQNSTALGNGSTASGQNSTAIGHGATVAQANTIRLGNNDAKVGVGTSTPVATAIMEISATNKGILIPRVALTNTTIVAPVAGGTPTESLLVYNTNTAGDVTPGFYYWASGAWNALTSSGGGGGSGGWGLTGNSVVGTDFLGTTNYQPLRFTVNNSSYGQFHPLGGMAIGRTTTANNNNAVALGTSATASSNKAVAIGDNATASGQNSTALGTGAVASQMNAVVLGDVSNANVGIGTSTPNTSAKLDVNGQFKLGITGTVQKGVSSFKLNGQYVGAIGVNAKRIITVTIPAAARPSTTEATVMVTAANGFDDDVFVGFAKLSNTSTLRVGFINTGAAFGGQTSDFYVTIIEF